MPDTNDCYPAAARGPDGPHPGWHRQEGVDSGREDRTPRELRYYFHVHDDAGHVDEEGMEFSSLEEVREEALLAAREIAAEHVREGKLNLSHRIEVMDEQQRPVLSLPLRDAIMVEG